MKKDRDLNFRDMIGDIGMEIGNVIVLNSQINIDSLELSRKEYPKNEMEVINSSDRLLLTWIEHLPEPKTNDEWNIFEAILKVGQTRNLITRYTDLRIRDSNDYNGEERRKTKPLRIL